MAFLLMLFQHCSRCHFLSPLAITLFRFLFNVLILALFFLTNTAQMLLPRHLIHLPILTVIVDQTLCLCAAPTAVGLISHSIALTLVFSPLTFRHAAVWTILLHCVCFLFGH